MLRTIVLVIFAAASFAVAGEGNAPDCLDADTQLGLNKCAGDDRKTAERQLLATLDAIRARHKDDETFLESLAASQEAWTKFRDAELRALYPHHDETGYYGSVFPMCWGLKAAELTRKRTKELRVWLEGVTEGDVCAGSVPFTQPK